MLPAHCNSPLEKLKKKLEEEGLFAPDSKPLPLLPRRIGIVTSPTGAAIRDILHVIKRRFANVHILVYPARVQGEEERRREIVEGIRVLDEMGVDVMIVGRGGGSLEDLWPFNEEIVVRAIHAANTPIISAVGHEIDFTLADFAADLRAPTPSAAAEVVVKEQEALAEQLACLGRHMGRATARVVEQARTRHTLAVSSFVFRRPEALFRQRRQQVDDLRMRLEGAVTDGVRMSRRRLDHAARSLALLSPTNQVARAKQHLAMKRQRLEQGALKCVARARSRFGPLLAQLDALSPLAVLARGYALAWKTSDDTLVQMRASLLRTIESGYGLGKAGRVHLVGHYKRKR